MRNDLYTALSGAYGAWRQLEIVSNNVANVGTTGFRAQHASFTLDGAHTKLDKVTPTMTDGALITDGNPTHLAVRGPAFFALADGSFTRDGSFQVDGEGQLVTHEGTPVRGDAGPIQLERGEAFVVASDGTVTGEISGAIGRLDLVLLEAPEALGGNRWRGTASAAGADVTVVQGALEGSNADPMRGMIELIEASRYFEVQQKAMQTSDEMRQRINRIGGA